MDGFTPIFANVQDGIRVVQRIAGFTDGSGGVVPPGLIAFIGQYVGPDGYTSNIAAATNLIDEAARSRAIAAEARANGEINALRGHKQTRLEIIQEIQARIGDEPITSEDDAGADLHIRTYDSTVRGLLSRYPWTFNTPTRRLGRLAVQPEQRYAYYFQMPSDMIGGARAVYSDAKCDCPITNFDIEENRLLCDEPTVYLTYSKLVDPGLWPGYFRELFNTVLMSSFALSIREDTALYRALRDTAYGPPNALGESGLFSECKNLDAQSHSHSINTIGSNPLVDVRTG